MSDVASFVLAGGKSSRMGCDKASLVLGGKTLLERAVDIARAASDEVCIVGSTERLEAAAATLGLPIIADQFPGQGPLAGIQAALTSNMARELNVVVAVDTPFITPEFVIYLIERSRAASGREAVVARVGGRLHPLCGVYRRGFAARSELALKKQRNKIESVIETCKTLIIAENELVARSFSAEMFVNINTREEFTVAEAKLRG